MNASAGIVYLVGAGPGDPGLITVRGWELLRAAEVVVHDRLVAPELLAEVRGGAELIDAGKEPHRPRVAQEGINQLLIDRARKGRLVVRLKGGDPFVFARGFEELAACRAAGVECVVVSGVTSAIAAPAAAGIPVTDRSHVRAFAVATARTGVDSGAPELDFPALAAMDTLVILMGRENLREIAQSLIHAGRDSSTPAACIEWGTTSRQRVSVATLNAIADAVERDGLQAPVVTVVGAVAAHARAGQAGPRGGLFGRRVVVTRPASAGRELQRRLIALGAIPMECPMIKIVYPSVGAQRGRHGFTGDSPGSHAGDANGPCLPAARESMPRHTGYTQVGRMTRHDWIVFTSVHGVIGFFRRLRASDGDARALSTLRVAAIGPGTARALRRRGIKADLMPTTYTAEALALALLRVTDAPPRRVLFPCSDRARPTLPDTLRAAGVQVDAWVVYRTVDETPSAAMAGRIANGVEAVLFHSPSAVQRWVGLGYPVGSAVVACSGPTTAAVARAAGLAVDIVAEEHSVSGLVRALQEYFSHAGATA